jgi:hypothetical protein
VANREAYESFLTCTDCEAKLRLRSTPAPGARVRCPRCATVFAPDEEELARPTAITRKPAPKPVRRADPDEEEDGRRGAIARKPTARARPLRRPDREDDFDEDDRPRRKKKRRVRKEGNPALFWGLTIGGSVLALGLVVTLLIVFWPFGSKYDAVMKETIGLLNELAGVLEGVKDRDSARAAAPKIDNLTARLEAVAKKADALPQPSEAENKRLEQKWKKDIEKVMGRLLQASVQAGTKSGGEPTFVAALQKMQGAGASFGRLGR